MSFNFREKLAAAKEAGLVRKYFSEMPREERGPLVVFAGTKWQEFGFDAPIDVEQTIAYLMKITLAELKVLHKDSKEASAFEDAAANAVNPFNAMNPANPMPENGKFMKFFVPEGYDAVQAMVVLRDIKDADALSFVALNVDAGNYVPVSPRVVAQLLVNAAEQMNQMQDEIEQAAQGH